MMSDDMFLEVHRHVPVRHVQTRHVPDMFGPNMFRSDMFTDVPSEMFSGMFQGDSYV